MDVISVVFLSVRPVHSMEYERPRIFVMEMTIYGNLASACGIPIDVRCVAEAALSLHVPLAMSMAISSTLAHSDNRHSTTMTRAQKPTVVHT